MKIKPAFRLVLTGSPAAYLLAAATAALLTTQAVRATDFAWDPVNDGNGGAGTWDTASLYWDAGTAATGSNTNIAWVNGATNNAYFGGFAGTINLGSSITAGSLSFSTAGYIINTGTNTLTLDTANTGTAGTINFNSTGTLALLNAGDGTGATQNVDFLENVSMASNGTITVSRAGSVAINKTLQLGSLTLGANTLTVTNNNGYGLAITGSTTLSGAATFNVANSGASNVVNGLTLAGPVTGGYGLTKSGAGTLVLGSASNSFGTGGSLIDITGGMLQVASNAALGDSANVVRLSANSTTQGLRLAGGTAASPTSYTLTGRTINLNGAASGIDVTGFTTATLDTAFGSSAITNTLQKNDNGVLAFASGVDNSSLTGAWTINAGAIRIANNLNLNSAATAMTIASRSALQLTGGTTLNRSGVLTLNGGGINSAGALQSVGGSNTVSSLITLGSAAIIGADSGSSLNISGGIAPAATTLGASLASGTAYTTLTVAALPVAVASGQVITISNGVTTQNVVASAAAIAGATSITVTSFTANAAYALGSATTPNNALTFAGSGNISISSTPISNAVSSITDIGSGTLAITANSATSVTPITLDYGGTLSLSGAGVLGSGAGTINVSSVSNTRVDQSSLASAALPAGFQTGSYIFGQMVAGMNSTNVLYSGAPVGSAGTAVSYLSGVQALGGSSIVIDNSGSNVNNRLGGRAVGLGTGGSLTLTASAAGNVSETVGGFALEMGNSVVTLNAGLTTQTNFVAPGLSSRTATEPTALIRGTNLGSAAGSGVATFTFTTAPTFVGITTALGTPTGQGILPQIIVDASATGYGTSFATTSGAGQVLRPLAASELTSGSAMTSAANVLVSAASTTSAAWTSAGNQTLSVNSLTLNSSGSVNIAAVTPTFGSSGNILNITSGGLLATGTNSISGGILQWGSQLDVYTPGANASATTLTISSRLTSAGLIKAGGGTLVLNNTSPAYSGLSANAIGGYGNHASNVYINEGTLQLGANNAISSQSTANGTNDNSSLTVSGSGILDLNGHTQWVGKLTNQFFNDNFSPASPMVMAGGTITNTSANPASLLVNTGNPGGAMPFSWGGTISGNLGFSFYGSSNAQYFQGAGTYTGPTLIDASNLTLRDFGTMSGTSTLEINSTTFTIDNNSGLANINNRLNGSAALLLNNGTLTYNGRAQTASVDSVGATTLNQGVSVLNINAGATGVNSADFTLAILARTSNSAATIEFNGNGALGTIGSGQGRIAITSAPTLSNNIIGGWALANGNAFASYIPYSSTGGVNVGGVGALNSAGYAAFDSTATSFTGTTQPTWNVSAATVAISGTVILNTLAANGATSALTFATNSSVLNLVSGGLLLNSGSNTVGTAVGNGSITAGGTASSGVQDLYFWTGTSNNNTNILRSTIIDNGSGAQTRLVVTTRGNGNQPLTMYNGTNTYTGGTVLNTSANLQATSGVVIPNDATGLTGLVLNNSALVMTVSAGQIGSGNAVTLNGGSGLTLFGNNTLAGLKYTNNYGPTAPTVNTGGILTLTGGITTTSESDGNTGAAIVGLVSLPTSAALSIGAATFNTLIINPLQADFVFNGVTGGGGAMTKSGTGVLQFNAIGALSGALDVTTGGLQSGGTNGGSRLADVTLENGTWLNINGNSSLFGSLAGTGFVTNSGALNTLTVGSSNASSTFAGSFQRFSDSTVNLINLTKIGTGTMSLTGTTASTASGTLTLNSSSGGGVTFSGSNGVNNFRAAAVTVNADSVLNLDNTTLVANRLGSAGVTLSGGTLNLSGGNADESGSALTVNSGLSTLITGANTLSVKSFARGVGGTLNIGASTVKFITSAPGLTNSILPGVFVGNDFATVSAINTPVTAYAAYTNGDLGTTGASTNNFKPTAAQTNVTASKTINSLSLTLQSGIVEAVTVNSGQTLTLGAGSLINNGGGDISGGFLTTSGNAELIANYATSGSITSIISGTTGGLTKLGAGNLTLGARDWYTGQTTVDQGTLTLGGGNNTLAANQTLVVNKGGTLDLGANNQYVGSIVTPGTVENSGGTITGSGVLTTNAANGTFGGSIGGSVNLVKATNNSGHVLTLVSANSTTGAISVLGGTLSLKDGGTLSGTSAIKVNNATLTLDNTGFANNINRINDSTPITLTGAVFTFNGAPSVASTETIGAVTLASGASRFNISPNVTTSSTIAGGADLTIGSLTQTAGSAATVYFNPMGPSNNGAYGQAGLANPRINITTAPTLTNNIIGPWAVVMQTGNNNNGFNGFASYIPYTTVNGVTTGGLGSLGDAGYAAYNSTAVLNSTNQPTWNVKNSGTITGSNTVYSLTDGIPVFSTATDMVNVVSGGWIIGAGGQAIGAALDSGRITAGGSNTVGINDLYLYNYTNSRTLNSRIVDNPSNGSVRLVLTTGDGNVMTMVNNLNSYTGGTVVNWTTTTLAATAAGNNAGGANVIPAGGLTINNSTITETVSAGQINPTNVVTFNGGAALTLFGTETLAGLVFNSNGGASTPTVSLAASSTLTLNGDITVTPTNVAVTPIIKPVSGTATLDLNGASRNITVTALAEGNSFQNGNNWSAAKGLTISSVIQNGALTVKGGGVLELSGANKFAGQLTVEAGALCVGSVNNVSSDGVLGNSASAVILGKTGGQTGTLEYTGNSTSSSKPFTMASGGTGAFQVDTSGQTLTLSGLIDGSGGLTKTGPGALTLSGAKTYSGDTAIKGGTLALAATGSIANSPNIIVGDTGSTAAVLDVSAVTGGLTVGSTQTLKGIGAITGAVNVTGVLAPGVGVGTLSSGSLSFLNSSTYQYQVNSSVATSAGADLQIVNGTLSLAGTVNLNLSNIGSGSFAAGTVFSLFNYTTAGTGLGSTGLFTYNSAALPEDATFNFAGRTWSIDYDATTKGANVTGAQAGSYVNITSSSDPYAIWAAGTFAHGTLSDPTPGGDSDSDGVTNLQEFAFGTDPTVSSTGSIVYNGTDVITPGTPKIVEDGGVFYAVFGRRSDYQTAGITYTVQFSADLSSGNWTTSSVSPTELTSTGTIHAVKVQFPGLINSANGLQNARFFRVGVSQP